MAHLTITLCRKSIWHDDDLVPTFEIVSGMYAQQIVERQHLLESWIEIKKSEKPITPIGVCNCLNILLEGYHFQLFDSDNRDDEANRAQKHVDQIKFIRAKLDAFVDDFCAD